jgi:two-component system response regulator YesN
MRTVLADDDICLLMLVENLLEREFAGQLAVHSFDDSRRACDWLETNECDLLLSDLEMPGCDGFDLLHAAKQTNAWTQVVFITAHNTWNRVETAIGLGAVDYLLKPIEPTSLRRVISAACERHERWHKAMTSTMQLQSPT